MSYAAGRHAAAQRLGVVKTAFSWGGIARGASRVMGALPTGFGNLAAGALGGVTGFMGARAEGHGLGASLMHGLGGASAGIPGGVGLAASMAAPAAISRVVGPPPPKPVGSVGG